MNIEMHIDEFEQMLPSIDVNDVYLKQLFDIYHQRLLANADACQKLARRGINMESIAYHHIGFCDRKLNRYVQTSDTPDGAGFRGALRRLGLIKVSGHEIFRGCIVEPVFDGDTIVAVCGVKLTCPSRPAPRIIQWYRHSVYVHPVRFNIMIWGIRYVTH
ncbi:hypothetical protein N5094_05225 [Shewanella putrefaciens]|uniref:hypothetical protein n=1 Tax=Shewanella putrefaciens TaxID=24 RepID=UPI0021BF3D2C|nr:hypothetical protein [Shewanella putrefaciens]UXK09630.1 hypothetical protein N5094_05225 [Shewanella putrefaciens]